jgi:DNA-binding CsgD family transcriptional regulator
MVDETRLTSLIEAIYDAAADPTRWSNALCLLADAYGASAAALGRQGDAPGEFWGVAPRNDPAFLHNYVSYYHSVNPIWQRVPSTPAGTVQTDSMVMPRSEFVRTEFYNDYLLPHGIASMLNAVVSLEEGRQTVVTIHGQREFEPDQIKLHRRLAPHLERAVQLNIKLANLEMVQTASVEALNQLEQGALLVDARATVLFANRAAEGLFLTGCGLRLSAKILRANITVETTRLHALIAGCAQDGVEAGAGGRISLWRGPGKAPLSVLVAPLRCESPFSRADRPVAVLFVTDPDQKAKPLVEQIRRQFRLTGAEAAFAIEILKGDGIQAAADRLAISRSTARTHLSHIFEKTGTHRQSELVRLLMQM